MSFIDATSAFDVVGVGERFAVLQPGEERLRAAFADATLLVHLIRSSAHRHDHPVARSMSSSGGFTPSHHRRHADFARRAPCRIVVPRTYPSSTAWSTDHGGGLARIVSDQMAGEPGGDLPAGERFRHRRCPALSAMSCAALAFPEVRQESMTITL